MHAFPTAPTGIFMDDGNKPVAHGYGINAGSPLVDDLVGLYPIWEGSGSQVQDISGNGNDGVNHGATWLPSSLGPVLGFSVAGRRVEVPNILETGDYSVELWVYVNTLTAGSAVGTVLVDNSQSGGIGFRLFILNDSGTYKLKLINNFLFSSTGAIDSSAFPIGRWVHCVGTSRNTGATATTQVYIDGVLRGAEASSDDYVQDANLYGIGDHVSSSGSSIVVLDGQIAITGFYDRVLSLDEIKFQFENPFALITPETQQVAVEVTAGVGGLPAGSLALLGIGL